METIIPLLAATKKASAGIRHFSGTRKTELLNRIADLVEANIPTILAANQLDLDAMDDTDPKKDRLLLNEKRISGLANSLRSVAVLPDPAGKVLEERTIEQDLHLKKVAVPMGVVGVIYESRPNVTLDVASLSLRSGNACVLKGGKEAKNSNEALVTLIHQALEEFGLDKAVVTLLPTDRKFTSELLGAVAYVDLIIPRGSEALIQFVRQNSKIPTIETGAGVCHTYIESTADLERGARIVVNAKVSRPSVCNSLDTILVDESVASEFLPLLKDDLIKWNVEIFADEIAYPVLEAVGYPFLKHAEPAHFGMEFLDYKCSVKIVSGLDDALDHIAAHSSRHSEAIISRDEEKISRFQSEVDAAAVYANASTRFTDGEVFGLGAEIGISTQKLHARGPFALEKLVTEKWIINGDGQIR